LKLNLRKLTTAAMLVAVSVALSTFSIPIGASRCFPIQHMINVISAVFLGPVYGVCMAFCTSLIRNLMGTGSLLAFPGSMTGALFCGLMFRYTKNLPMTYLAEIIGTGILGALICYPVAAFVLGQDAALFTFVLPFLLSTVCGTVIAAVLIGALYKSKAAKLIHTILYERE
jgi:energy coupling factor transporter S component ThiW